VCTGGADHLYRGERVSGALNAQGTRQNLLNRQAGNLEMFRLSPCT
jgi:hypothetical protein